MKRTVSRISLTINEACEATGLSRHTMDALIKVGLLKTVKTGLDGGKAVLLVNDVQSLLERARDSGFVLNDDYANLARIKASLMMQA